MRFSSFMYRGSPAWGLVDGNQIRVSSSVLGAKYPTLALAIAGDGLQEAYDTRAETVAISLSEAIWLPVIPNPGKIFCIGLNYDTHIAETGRSKNLYPPVFMRVAESQTAHNSPLLMPTVSDRLDYEGELAIIIGKGGRAIPASESINRIAGFACYNDGSVRDWQKHTSQFTPGKNFPATGGFGPWMVTPDEFGAPGPQRLQTRLNGKVMQEAYLREMVFGVGQLVEYVSTFTPLKPGDIIVSGTPGGVGSARDPQVFMKPDDLIEVEIDGIGILSNRVARE